MGFLRDREVPSHHTRDEVVRTRASTPFSARPYHIIYGHVSLRNGHPTQVDIEGSSILSVIHVDQWASMRSKISRPVAVASPALFMGSTHSSGRA